MDFEGPESISSLGLAAISIISRNYTITGRRGRRSYQICSRNSEKTYLIL